MNQEELTVVGPDSVEMSDICEVLREKGYTPFRFLASLFRQRFTDNDGYVQEVCSLYCICDTSSNNPRSHCLEISHLRLSDDTFEGLIEQVRQLPGGST